MARPTEHATAARSALILADIEGIVGVYRKRQCKPGTAEWRTARDLMTADVNAAVRGLRSAGVEHVVVRDMHGPGYNLRPEGLEPGVVCIQGQYGRPLLLLGQVPRVDCAVMIGWHAGPDQEGAFSPHMFHRRLRAMRVNDDPVTEVELFAAALGDHGVPVIAVTADEPALERITGNLPWVASVRVPKRELSRAETDAVHLEIEQMCQRAAADSSAAAPLVLGQHRAEMVTTGGTDTWVARSGVETFTRAVAGSVFRPYPRSLAPLLVTLYRWWCRLH